VERGQVPATQAEAVNRIVQFKFIPIFNRGMGAVRGDIADIRPYQYLCCQSNQPIEVNNQKIRTKKNLK
jgi:hypothetical protein